MSVGETDVPTSIRYQPDESPPAALTIGLGVQLAVLTIATPIMFPMVVMRAAGMSESYAAWAVFAAVVISGITTALQAIRLGRFGGGHVLVMGSAAAFLQVSILAVVEGGPAMLATLVVVCALVQFALSERLAQFRRFVTPTISGTVFVLIPVTVMPVVFDMLAETPQGAPAIAGVLSAIATALVICGISLTATGALRLWAPIVGVITGSVVAGFFGLYDLERVSTAGWLGLPQVHWPGVDLGFGASFWALLPAFLLLTMSATMKTVSNSVAVQSVSWRRSRALQFRSVQGAVATESASNLLCGVAGTTPNTSYSMCVSLTELTGVAARRVGIAAGGIIMALAFCPKALALVLAIPGPVVAAYLGVLMAALLLVGVSIVIRDGLDHRKALIAGSAFWVGLGVQNDMIFPEHVANFAGGLLQNGMTAGGLLAILMTVSMEMAKGRRYRFEAEFSRSALPAMNAFLAEFASRCGWDPSMATRLQAVGEETLLTLLPDKDNAERPARGRLRLVAYLEGGDALLEFVAAAGTDNLEDRMALLAEQSEEVFVEPMVSLRLLRRWASSVRHQQYHDTDVVTVRVQPPVR